MYVCKYIGLLIKYKNQLIKEFYENKLLKTGTHTFKGNRVKLDLPQHRLATT